MTPHYTAIARTAIEALDAKDIRRAHSILATTNRRAPACIRDAKIDLETAVGILERAAKEAPAPGAIRTPQEAAALLASQYAARALAALLYP